MNYEIYQNGKKVSDRREIDLLRDEAAGIFESMRAYNGQVFLLEEHLRRLFESAKTVGYESVPDIQELRREVRLALTSSGEKNTSVRLTLLDGEVFVILGSREIQDTFYRTGVRLKTASFPRGSGNAFPYQAKAASYQQAVLASTEPNPEKAFDWMFLDYGNYLTETRTGNFFIVRYLKYPFQYPELEFSNSGY